MIKIKKILAPADMSSLCISGIRFALELAQWQQSEVLIYNVLTVEETPFPQGTEEWVAKQTELPKLKKTLDQRKKLLDDFISKEFADLIGTTKIRQEVEIGTPYRRIVDKAAAESVDIIVMSTHGRTGLAHMLIGSVTERVLRRASCPVLPCRCRGGPNDSPNGCVKPQVKFYPVPRDRPVRYWVDPAPGIPALRFPARSYPQSLEGRRTCPRLLASHARFVPLVSPIA